MSNTAIAIESLLSIARQIFLLLMIIAFTFTAITKMPQIKGKVRQ